MNETELAERLVSADDAERATLLREHSALADVSLAYRLKDICLDGWSSDPQRATGAASALKMLAEASAKREVEALAAWGAGIEALVNGQMELAIERLDASETIFVALGKAGTGAATQISKLIALALLGRYEEAIETGLRAREVFIEHGDTLAAGRIEQNIGNIYVRRDRYQEGEQFLRAARERFAALDDQELLAQNDNNLVHAYTLQHKFRDAEELYQQALLRAENAGFAVTQAEIEASMGSLAFFQGRYDRALEYLERARRRYAALGMAHQSAISEQELADTYLELNLAPEAATIYERVVQTFAALGMRAEQAAALAHHGQALLLLGRVEEAHTRLAEARSLYAAIGSEVGEATVTLNEARIYHAAGDFDAAGRAAAQAEIPLTRAGNWRRLLTARWLRGEAARAHGDVRLAEILLESTLRDTQEQAVPQVAERCLTSLGLLAAAAGDRAVAEDFFQRAVSLIESLRAPLPAEEFRTAFVADKLAPYDELLRLCLSDASGERVAEAFGYVERARSRALVERMGGARESRRAPRDAFEAELLARLDELRQELNWFYSQINRPPESHGARAGGGEAMQSLHANVRERESMTLEIMRQLQQRGGNAAGTFQRIEQMDCAALQRELGADTALVEYTSLDGEMLAFVVTDERIEVVRGLGSEARTGELLTQLRFQIGSLRYGSERIRTHLASLTKRAQHYLGALYDLLLRPVEQRIGARRLIVVPHRALHYLPFHALYDGAQYVIEQREVSYAPSASVLRFCLAQPSSSFESALLLGVPDEQTPRVRDEIEALAPLFPRRIALVGDDATLDALRVNAPQADVLHLACHGQFRPDNPLFSSLRLGDGWLTVRDAYALELRSGLVTLSACETGVSAVAPGDELIGLARGFFSAGAQTLLLSLWTVDDDATARTMASFYGRLRAGDAPAAALRAAQLELLREQPHPFFWSPFVLVGRW